MNAPPKSPLVASDHLEPVIRLARRTVRFWRVAVVAFVIGMAATLGAAALRPKQYRSEAVLYYREGIQWAANEAMSPRRIAQRLKDTLLARSQLTKIIEDLGLFPTLIKKGRIAQAVEEMRLGIGFRVERESDVFVISYTGDSPAESQRVTAKLTDVLIGENARLRSEQAGVASQFLDAEKKRNEGELAAKEGEQLRFLARHPEFAQDQNATVGASLRARTRQGGDAADPFPARDDSTLGALQREEERLRRQIGLPGPRAAPDPVVARNEAEAKLRAARRELADRRTRFTDNHPDVRAAETAVKDAEDAFRRADALDADQGPVPPGVLEARLARVQQNIAAYQRAHPGERAASVRRVESGTSPKRMVALEAEWTRLSRGVAEARDRLQQLDTKQFVASMTASMTMSGQAAQIVVIDPAFLPPQPIGMARKRVFLMALVVAGFLAFGVAVLLAQLDDRVYDHVDVERAGLAPVLIEVAKPSLQRSGEGTVPAREPVRPGDELAAANMTLTGMARDAPLIAKSSPVNAAPSVGAEAAAGTGAGSGSADVPALQITSSGAESMAPPQANHMAIELAHRFRSLAVARQTAIESDPAEAAEEHVELVEIVRVHRVAPPRVIDWRLLMMGAPDSAAAASFRVLRQRLAERKGVRTILVTSPQPGEGKTLCAVNLALALGEAGRARVLLVEANFRRPSLARLLGFHPPICIGEQIEAHRLRSTQPWVVVEVATPWLHVAAVTPDTEVRPILDAKAFAICVEELRRAGYDYIVVDSPPTLGSADVNLLQESVDGVLMAMWAGRSHTRALGKAIEQIGGNKLLGVALLGT